MEDTHTLESLEIQLLQKQIDKAKEAQTELLRAKAAKAMQEAEDRKRETEALQKFAREEQERKRAEAKAAMLAAEEKKRAEKALEEAAQRRLEQEAEAAAEAVRKSIKHAAEVKALQERLFLEEQENQRIARELDQKSQPVKEEPTPVTLMSGPLGRVFGADTTNASIPEISYAENQQSANTRSSFRDVPQDEVGRLSDHITCYSGVRVTHTELNNMLSRFDYKTVEAAFSQVLIQHQRCHMSGIEIADAMQRSLETQ